MISLLLSTALLVAPTEDQVAKKVHNHLLIHDHSSALKEARLYLAQHPDSKAVRFALLRALCASGKEIEAMDEWNQICLKHGNLSEDRQALELLAWSVLNKGENSHQIMVRLTSLVGAALTKDAKAIPLILDELRGSNGLLRSVAISLAAEFGDQPLQDELERLLKEEKVWYVRLAVIQAVGQQRMTHLKPMLSEIIAHPKTIVEEKQAAIVAYVNMQESMDGAELQRLIKSPRAGLRQLACEIVAHFDLKESVSLILPLLKDSSSLVRLSALNAASLVDSAELKYERLFKDPAREVAITAARHALVKGDARGGELLKQWILDKDEEMRRLAAAALAVSGENGAALMEEMLKESKDPYVDVNLALGLIGLRRNVALSCKRIDEALQKTADQLLMWDSSSHPLFRTLAPSAVRHTPQISNYPTVVDQMTRLELLSTLCMMNYPKSLDAVKEFLQSYNWGATGAAAATLMREGDEEAVQVVRKLLSDPSPKVRLQAALVLAFLGGDKEALGVLHAAYEAADREVKIHILEALARIGDPSSVPFLLSILNEPFQVMRVVAASAIIQCLYH